ncbi:class I SAM-dependent RNA methyltransferase [Breznakiella homolactica]|uniref:Class I SAM-dependent RNA methyltransferase n=1 Tax=Breznakiella homolactica TaxID=2798577 RepID=A0A7T7XRS1_9SPIR|nr:class I SAM-dependent RNA methyltransferase [Breznakiella homolactica]
MLTAAALCAVGAERALSNELRKLGIKILESTYGRVRFQGGVPDLYRGLMALRTADRLLLECARFTAPDFDALFEGTASVPWETYIPEHTGLRVAKVRTSRSKLSAETSIQAVVHKAAAARLCRIYKIPSLPASNTAAELRVYIEKDTVSLMLDLSGEPLFKRGYRSEGGAAPLRETTAAAVLLLSGWRRKFPLYDPFCGSGTIAIEAAMYAWDMAPCIGREFSISRLSVGDAGTEAAVREELLRKIDFSRTIRISGSDADPRAVSIARSNIQRAMDIARGKKPGRGIRLESAEPFMPAFAPLPMEEAKAPAEEGFIITNPPYGKRLGSPEEAEAVYRKMEGLAENFKGWKLGVITDHPGFESHFGRKADALREITNGAMRSYFYEFNNL